LLVSILPDFLQAGIPYYYYLLGNIETLLE
jgi:hypothetical protein